MADLPLRTATRHRLGGPLPHQPPDRPRAPPKAPYGFARLNEEPSVCGISKPFGLLFPTLGQVAHVLRTRLPLTLRLLKASVRLTCVKHAASVHPEPGSNSPLYFNVRFLYPDSSTLKRFFPTTLQLLRFPSPYPRALRGPAGERADLYHILPPMSSFSV